MPDKLPRIFWNVVSIIFWLFSTLFLFYLMNNPDLPGIISRLGILGPAVVVFLFAVTAATPVSAEILLLSSGALFGPLIGSLTNIVGILISSMVEYYFGEKLFDAKTFARTQKKLPAALRKLPVESPLFLIGGKLLPWIGAKMVNLAAGAYRVPLSRQIWTSLIACLPGALFWGIGGNRLMLLFKTLLSDFNF